LGRGIGMARMDAEEFASLGEVRSVVEG